MISDQTFSQNNYQIQLDSKTQALKTAFYDAGIEIPDLSIYPSTSQGFRMRAEFRIWHEHGRAHYAMNHPGQKKPYIIDSFPIGSALINRLMKPILDAININSSLSNRLFSIEFLTTTSEEALVTLIYHRHLDKQWEDAAKGLQSTLNIKIIGRSRKQKVVLDVDYVTEKFTIQGKEYLYRQVESGFTQPNASINCEMLTWASQCLSGSTGDLIELYCGNGNFTAVLAQHFDHVLATEIAKVSVNSALHNFNQNQIDNVTVVRLSSEELTQGLNKEREFRRLAEVNLDGYRFSSIFVDPPRTGLDSGTEKLVTEFDNILYISCNPDSLIKNLQTITQTHRVKAIALFDQFPWTEHIETGVYLQRI